MQLILMVEIFQTWLEIAGCAFWQWKGVACGQVGTQGRELRSGFYTGLQGAEEKEDDEDDEDDSNDDGDDDEDDSNDDEDDDEDDKGNEDASSTMTEQELQDFSPHLHHC